MAIQRRGGDDHRRPGRVLALSFAGGRISFIRADERYEFVCDPHPHALGNLRAAQRVITLLHQAREEYHVTRDAATGDQFRRLLGNILALGVSPDASPAQLRATDPRKQHPGRGGDTTTRAQINAPRGAGLAIGRSEA